MPEISLIDRLAPLIDERCGIIRRVRRFIFPPGFEGQMHGFTAFLGRPAALHPGPSRTGSKLGSLTGSGTAVDETTAQIRAVCEALERYCGVMYPTEGVLRATPRSLGDRALDPARLPRCSARERARAPSAFRLREPDPDRDELWVRGFSLTHERPIWVPLTATYMGLPLPIREHALFPLSTGFAAGAGFRQAILSGLCEVIERDSLALFWLHQLRMPRIAPGSARSPLVAALLRSAEAAGTETALLDLTTDVGVPVIGAVQTCAHSAPHAIAMAACRPDGEAAAARVLEEVGSLRVALSEPAPPVTRASFFADADQTPESFGRLYAGPDGPARFAFATREAPVATAFPRPIEGDDPLAAIVARLAALGMEVVAVDVTMPEVRDFGIVVVKVIVPELLPISFTHHARYLAHPRLYDAPERLGYGARTEESITDDPIPFA
ncbi:YcaO-like family protein [Sorangium sp. So ce281]|uniref:YcaO-like family protein n=1 Tax=Sorangium sp. So ce281 TaxID=3133293 RepID=UPI003F5F520B